MRPKRGCPTRLQFFLQRLNERVFRVLKIKMPKPKPENSDYIASSYITNDAPFYGQARQLCIARQPEARKPSSLWLYNQSFLSTQQDISGYMARSQITTAMVHGAFLKMQETNEEDKYMKNDNLALVQLTYIRYGPVRA